MSDVELAIKTVINRVLLGGHDVPETDQRRRYRRSLEKARELFQNCDEAFVYLNDALEPHQLVAVYERGMPTFKNIQSDWLP
jgi:predicted ABC-type ATPase